MTDEREDKAAEENGPRPRRLPAMILGRELREVLVKHGIDPQETRASRWDDGERCPPLVLEQACDIPPAETPWLWPWRIPHRRLTILAGQPRERAAAVAFDVAARVSRGACWPDQAAGASGDLADESRGDAGSGDGEGGDVSEPRDAPDIVPAVGNVLVISANGDTAETVVPALLRARADMQRVYCVSGVLQRNRKGRSGWTRDLALPEDFRSLRRAIRELGPLRLVVIDAIEALLHSSSLGWGPRIAEGVVACLIEIARECDVAIIGVAELRGTGGRGGMGLSLKHPALATGAQAAWGIARVPGSERHLMLPINFSVGSPGPPLEFTRAEGAIEWSAAPAIVAGEDAGTATEEGLAVAAGMTWLRNVLASGALPAVEVGELARDAGMSRTLLRRVKAEIGVQSEKSGCRGKSYWSLPEAAAAIDRGFASCSSPGHPGAAAEDEAVAEKVRAFEVDPAPLDNSREISKARGDEGAPRV